MCGLIDELKRLKKSSIDAIDNENEFSKFKQYMHVHRQVETHLIDIIKKVKNSHKKSLILVCGNVGDGKSHLISYLKNTQQGYLDEFIVHNDATESLGRDLDEKQTLSIVLKNFKDENLDNDENDKVIVAINLGVLNNFINSSDGSGFSKLAEYVNRNKILIDTEINDDADELGIFYHINFGDYHIYRLNDCTVDSPYIDNIIEKIVSESDENPFYNKYSQCALCGLCDCCPVKHNYELLNIPKVKEGLINVILETLIKDKILLSTRDLLNFLFDVMVHPEFNKEKYSKLKADKKLEAYIEYTIPSMLYEHEDISPLMLHIKQYDFITQRTETFDRIVTRFYNTNKIENIFNEYIVSNPCVNQILAYNINKINDKKLRMSLIIYFSRFCKIASINKEILIFNPKFSNFIKDLYYFTKRDKAKIKDLYNTVNRCIYLWSGSNLNENDTININTYNKDYIISAHLEIKPEISDFGEESVDNIFERFPAYINITFCKKNDSAKNATISIDYDLYKMLKKVEKGYRPSVRDFNYYVSFVSFINKLSEFSSLKEEIIIKKHIRDNIKEYILQKDSFGSYEFTEVR